MHIPQDELQKFQDGTMNTDEMIHFSGAYGAM